MISLAAGEKLLRDYWPAEVAVGGTVHKLARVYVTDQRVVVVTMVNGRPRAVVDDTRVGAEVLHRNGVQGGRTSIETVDFTVVVGAAHGCGCSSPLRALPLPR